LAFLVLGPVASLADLFELSVSCDAASRTLLAPKAAKQTCKAAALSWCEALVRVVPFGARCRGRAERDSRVDEDE
jgi:hypothetical protein